VPFIAVTSLLKDKGIKTSS